MCEKFIVDGVFHLLKLRTELQYYSLYIFISISPHLWRSGTILKAGRREVPGSNPNRACRPSRSDFSVVFSETRVNMGWDPIERPPREGAFYAYAKVPSETIGLKTYNKPTNKPSYPFHILFK